MPGWYVHTEAAHEVARRLRNGEIPAGFAVSETEAKEIGEMCHTWRNYLALGAIGPDPAAVSRGPNRIDVFAREPTTSGEPTTRCTRCCGPC
jgi:hypothetical protein